MPLFFRLGRKIFLLFMLALLYACSEPPLPPLTLASNNWIGYHPIYLADKLGYVDEKKLNIVQLGSTSELMRHLRAGTVDIGAATLDEALLLLQDQVGIKVILVADFSSGSDAIIGQSAVSSLSELKNKRVGVEKTALGAYVLDRALAKTGLSTDQVNTVSLEFSEHADAFMNNRVDAVVTFEPVKSLLVNKGGKVLFDSTQIPGEIIDVFLVTDDVLQHAPDRVEYFVAAWYQGLKYLQTNPQQSYELLSSSLDLSYPEFEQALAGIHFPDADENRVLFANNAAELEFVRQNLMKTMLKTRLLHTDVSMMPLFDGRFVSGVRE